MDYYNLAKGHRPMNEALIVAKDRTPYIEIEKEFQKIIDAYNTGGISKGEVAARKHLRLIGDIVEETFNFKRVTFFNIGSPMTLAARFTVNPFDNFRKRKVIYTSHGLAFKEKIYSMMIFIGMNNINKFTAKELTAVLTHEIGHAFDESLLAKVIVLIPQIYPTLLAIDVAKVIAHMHQKSTSDYKSNSVLSGLKTVESKFEKGLEYVAPFISVPTINMINLIKNNPNAGGIIGAAFMIPIMMLANSFKFGSEVEADRFAASCGYGPELGSALSKFDQVEHEVIAKNPVLNALFLMTSFLSEIFPEAQSQYMIKVDRLKAMKQYVDKASGEAIDPAVRADLRQMSKDMDNIISAHKKKDAELYTRAIADQIFPGRYTDDDVRDLRFAFFDYDKNFGIYDDYQYKK